MTKPPSGCTPGRPRIWDDATRERARLAYLQGDSPAEIAAAIGCSVRSVRTWIKAGQWGQELAARRATIAGLERQIAKLSQGDATASKADRVAKLTKSLRALKQLTPTPKPRPTVRAAVHEALREQALSPEYGLYQFQRDFLLSDARFRAVLKSRQIGFSYVIGLGALLGAAAGRGQLVVSASEDQAQIILRYCEIHAERLGLTLDVEGNTRVLNGVPIRALSTNFRTVQGHAGDVWFDEFAWLRTQHQKRLWGALVPSITAVGGRVTITSTPFIPGTLHWEIAENHNGRWPQFERTRITIHEAVAQGMPLPGGIEELRGLFDADTWAMFYLCEYAEGQDNLLSWAALHALTVPDVLAIPVGHLRGGVDIGRTGHRYARILLGQELLGGIGGYTDRFALRHWRVAQGLDFATMRKDVQDTDALYEVEHWAIDRTGLGMQLAEELIPLLSGRATGHHFDARKKERWALNLLKLVQDKRLILPNDPDVLAALHAVRKIVQANGVRYDAPSDDLGHGDLFWAVAMAADGRARHPHNSGVKVEVWH